MDVPGATWFPSPNFTAAPVLGKTVVIHSTRSGVPHLPQELAATLNWFAKPNNVSAHLVIDRNGSLVQCVDLDRQAWHARELNELAWGIELCQSTVDEAFTDAQYQALRVALSFFHTEFGVPLVHATGDHIEGLIGHDETAPGHRDGKTDPGYKFDWRRVTMEEQMPLHEMELSEEGAQLIVNHNKVAVLKLGDVEGKFPGRIAKLFGDTYAWLRRGDDGNAFWSETEGD